jgi:hypothetical protein
MGIKKAGGLFCSTTAVARRQVPEDFAELFILLTLLWKTHKHRSVIIESKNSGKVKKSQEKI